MNGAQHRRPFTFEIRHRQRKVLERGLRAGVKLGIEWAIVKHRAKVARDAGRGWAGLQADYQGNINGALDTILRGGEVARRQAMYRMVRMDLICAPAAPLER